MKNQLSKIVISALLITSSLMADESAISYSYDNVYSFVGIEGGIGRLDVEKDNGSVSTINKKDMYFGGIKIGAQTDNYKIYLNANYYEADDFDYMTTYGVGLQYMFNFSKHVNAFLGLSAGVANMRFLVPGETSRIISDPYVGGEGGFNIHLG